jgi:signal transduction histidine kinase
MTTASLRTLSETPIRFYALAALGAVVTITVGSQVEWDPWQYENSILAEGWGEFAAQVTLAVWTAVPLLALRWPVPAALLALVPFALFTVLNDPHEWSFALFLALIGAAMVAVWQDRRWALLVAGAALLPVGSYLLGLTTILLPYETRIETWSDQGALERVITFGAYVVAVLICLGIALWMRRSAVTARRSAQLRARSEEVERASAVVGERARLARDLHDVVAHHVSLIAVRAETAPYTVPDLPPAARSLLAEIAADSRQALEELRGVLGILRRADDSPELAPQPTAGDIAALVEQARGAGASIEWETADLGDISPTAGYVAYRVVQELLTNARRHAGSAVVHLSTEQRDGGLTVRATNAVDGPITEGGGLVGMRERVEGLGGRVTVSVRQGMLEVVAEVPSG